MWVAPFARGRGVGDRLVDAVIEWAAQQRAARVVLAVMESNEHAARLYRRHGFVDVGIVEGNPADAPAERRMVRELNLARGET
ncbi:MAG: GNAT family N-acetyltransferase [Vulcanimicrobiaceae bacterium]